MLALVDIDLTTGRARAIPVIREDENAEAALEGLFGFGAYLMPAARFLARHDPRGVVYCPVPDRPAGRPD